MSCVDGAQVPAVGFSKEVIGPARRGSQHEVHFVTFSHTLPRDLFWSACRGSMTSSQHAYVLWPQTT